MVSFVQDPSTCRVQCGERPAAILSIKNEGLPRRSSVKRLHASTAGAWVWSLDGELGSHMPCGMTKKRKWRSSPPHPTFCFLYKKRHRTGCLGSLVLPMAMIWDDPRCPSPCPCFFPIALSISDIPPSEVHSCILITITTVIHGQGPHISHFIGSWEGGLLLTQIWRLTLGRAASSWSKIPASNGQAKVATQVF